MENKETSLEHQRQELRPQKSGKERFLEAKRAPKIGMAINEEIKQALNYAMVKMGLRGSNFPSQEEGILLVNHVIENFPGNTLDEIRLAFDWAIEGRLDEDINCFENFSCLYFTRIMRAYNRLACKVRDEANVQKQLPKTRNQEPAIEDPEAYEKFLQTGFAQILKGKGIEIPKF